MRDEPKERLRNSSDSHNARINVALFSRLELSAFVVKLNGTQGVRATTTTTFISPIRSTEQPVYIRPLPSKKLREIVFFRGGGGCTQAIHRNVVMKSKIWT